MKFKVKPMTEKWLTNYCYEETKEGWLDGPVWRFPKELKRFLFKQYTNRIRKAA